MTFSTDDADNAAGLVARRAHAGVDAADHRIVHDLVTHLPAGAGISDHVDRLLDHSEVAADLVSELRWGNLAGDRERRNRAVGGGRAYSRMRGIGDDQGHESKAVTR